jgi:hypothetical protein
VPRRPVHAHHRIRPAALNESKRSDASAIDHADLTARFNALREVVQRDIKASQDLATIRMDASDASRIQHLAALAEERAALERQITLVRELQDTYHAAMQHQVEVQAAVTTDALKSAASALQLQLDQRFEMLREGAVLLQTELDRRVTSLRLEAGMLETKITSEFSTVRREAGALQLQLDQRFATEAEARRVALETATAAIRAALNAAETAVNKAEIATEKRFDAVNEFRKSLADQNATFPTRIEVNAQLEAISETGIRNANSIKDLELRLTSRLDTASGRSAGHAETRSEHRLDTAQVMQLLALVVVAIGVIISIVLKS